MVYKVDALNKKKILGKNIKQGVKSTRAKLAGVDTTKFKWMDESADVVYVTHKIVCSNE